MPCLSMSAAAARAAALLVTCAAMPAVAVACPLGDGESATVPSCHIADRGDTMLQVDSKTIKKDKRAIPFREDPAKWKSRFGTLPVDKMFTQAAWEDAVDAAFGMTEGSGFREQDQESSKPIASIKANTYGITNQVVDADKTECRYLIKDKENIKNPAKPAVAADHECNSAGDPAVRAMSLYNIQRVESFLIELAKSSKSGDELIVPKYEGGEETKKVTEVNMHNVNAILVKPLTFHTKLSFVAHIGGGKPDYFVSHNWSGKFLNFANSILAHFEGVDASAQFLFTGHYANDRPLTCKPEEIFYWVCTFANNQHEGFTAAEIGDPEDVTAAPFYRGIQLVQQVVSIQDESEPGHFTLNRAWCMFEMIVALEFKKPTVFMCSKGNFGFSEQGPLNAEDHTKIGDKCTTELTTNMFKWNPGDAKASGEIELEKIKEYIETLGCQYAEIDTHKKKGGGMECLAAKITQIMQAGKNWERRGNIHGRSSCTDAVHNLPGREPSIVRKGSQVSPETARPRTDSGHLIRQSSTGAKKL